MVLPEPFTTASPYIVSVDFSDFSDAMGYKVYYLLKTNSAAGVVNTLTPSSAFYSYIVEYTQSPGTSTHNFDTSAFNIPRTVKGTAILNIGTIASQAGVDDTIKAQLWRVGETSTAITDQFTLDLNDADAVLSFSMPCTETLIEAGAYIRLVIIVLVTGGGEYIKWGHDPVGRAGTMTITSSRVNIPFKFDG